MPISARLIVNPAALKLKRDSDPAGARGDRRRGWRRRGGGAWLRRPRRFAGSTRRTRDFDAALARLTAFDTAQDEAIDTSVGVDHRRRARARRRGGARIHGAVRPRESAQRRGAGTCRRGTRGRAATDCPSAQRDALTTAASAHSRVSRAPARRIVVVHRGRRHAARPEHHAARPRRHLRAGRQGGVSVDGADERAAGACRRRRRDHHGRARRRTACAMRWCWPRRTSRA